jgi:hypothetical protein
MSQCTITFTFEAKWTDSNLIIECPSIAAQHFIKSYLDNENIRLMLKDRAKRGIK